MTPYFVEPELSCLDDFIRDYPTDTPVVMLNLLRFNEAAQYPAGSAHAPCSGPEAFGRYATAVVPLIASVGGETLWQGRQAAMLIGPQDKDWHVVVLVRYPSASAFHGMITSEAYQAISVHRTAALLDSRLIAQQELPA